MRASIVASLKASHRLELLLQIAALPRSTYFYHQRRSQRPDRFAQVKARIQTVFTQAKGRYGHRRIHRVLTTEGYTVAKKTVLALMHQLGLRCRVRRPRYNSYPGAEGLTAPHLLKREFTAQAPNHKWVTDVTEFRVAGTRVYLSPIIDLHDRVVISHSISLRPTTAFTNAALAKALESLPTGAGPLVHSDQGFQYRHASWRELLANAGAIQSMSRKANCYDNAIAENFFGHLKAEAFLERTPETVTELIDQIEEYIHWYNHNRIQERLEGLTPMQYRNQALMTTTTTTL
ncbi:IS3 family transposase [Kocuria soli]|uniref:IS3 family transposase n=1 Tax=Kocuria soli TaxID=2485125 RepID=A0A3N3ZM85_9MICC|nr:IS3 family transposase [Kocuria soli]ROZ61760.1 IS3 family transposase [Kocuria soli]